MLAHMQVSHRVRYDAPVAAVRAMLLDPAFRERAALAMGASAVDVAIDGEVVRIDMASQSHHIPTFVRPLVGDQVVARQAEDWTGDEASFSVTAGRIPAGVQGRRALVASGNGCIDGFEGEARARIPLVGGRLERLIAERLAEGWDIEHGVGIAWLAGGAG